MPEKYASELHEPVKLHTSHISVILGQYLVEVCLEPHTTHRYLLPFLGRCLSVLDEICKRSMNFVSTCLSRTGLVKYVVHQSIRFGLNFSLI